MAIENCTEQKTKIGSAMVCSPFERIASLVVESMFKYPFGCPAKFKREEITNCDAYTDCTIVHCPGECKAPDGFFAEIDDVQDVIYVRESEIGRPSRGDRFITKGQTYVVDAVTGSCGYTWRLVITELEDDCDAEGCDGLFD